jgi:hypothetical protein
MPKVVGETISGAELRRRLDALKPGNYTQAAAWLGLTRNALEKAMAGQRTVGRQTLMLLEVRESVQNSVEAQVSRGKFRSTRSSQ